MRVVQRAGFCVWGGLMMAIAMMLAGPAAADDHGGFKPLFDGESLEGWHNPYEWGEAYIENGEIRLIADDKFFLVTDKEYGDFVFEAEVKMPKGKANSGFMFRAHEKKNKVWGYQAEVDPSDRAWSGGLYDEGRRAWLNRLRGQPKKQAAFDRTKWNKYRIKCVGDRLQIWVNGVKTTDYRDPLDQAGHLALQHHGEDGKIYRFRNIRVKELGQHKWEPIFNGEDLTGWEKLPGGDWQVQDGVIVGTAPKSESRHGQLITKKQYKDFTARLKFKTLEGNSGFYFRVHKVDKPAAVEGFQAEIAPDGNVGGLYETYGRAWVIKPSKEQVKKYFKPNKWNEMTVSAHGGHIVVHVNGTKTAELTDDPGNRKGHLALQLHGGQKMHVQFKDIEVLRKAE